MGLAASQVRLLQLTSRQHKLEYEAQRIQAMKLQLANESDYAYTDYMNAIEAKKIQYRFVDDDGSISYKDATFANLFTYKKGASYIQSQYALQIASGEDEGKFYVTSSVAKAFESAQKRISKYINTSSSTTDTSELKKELSKLGLISDKVTEDQIDKNKEKYVNLLTAAIFSSEMGAREIISTTNGLDIQSSTIKDTDANSYYENLYLVLCTGKGVVTINDTVGSEDNRYDSSSWITNMIESGTVYLHKFETGTDETTDDARNTYTDIGRTGAWGVTTISNDVLMQEIADDKAVKKAEAKYEAETNRINQKDAQYDTLLSQSETERTAIKTEIDELKQVRNDNVEKYFKVFA